MSDSTEKTPVTMKDLKAADPRWCTGCGDYSILVGVRKGMVNKQYQPHDTVHVSGIGCSGRVPHYLETYGIHSIHGRAVPVALGVRLGNPNLKLFVHSGDGDSLSIGGNHLIHGIHKNINCVYILYDNQIYGLTKNQTSPTTRQGQETMTQPSGTYIDPINPLRFALGLKASFVASTADWMGGHLNDVLDKAMEHKGFAFVHVAQRCPKFNPKAWDYRDSSWMTFLTNEQKGVPADKRNSEAAQVVQHDPSNFEEAMKQADKAPNVFGILYQEEKASYDDIVLNKTKNAEQKNRSALLDKFII